MFSKRLQIKPFRKGWLFTCAVLAALFARLCGLRRTPAERLRLLLWPTAETVEWFSLRTGFWWWLLLLPALHLFASNPLFAGLARVAPEAVWRTVIGLLLILHGLAFLWGRAWQRALMLFLFGGVWAFIAVLTATSAPTGLPWPHAPTVLGLPLDRLRLPKVTGLGVYGTLSLDCFWAFIQLSRCTYIDLLVAWDRCLDSRNKMDDESKRGTS